MNLEKTIILCKMNETVSNLSESSLEHKVHFSAILRPYRSLSPKGFLIVMGLIGSVSFIAGIVFFAIGAWPVVGFLGLDVVLVYYAFKSNYKSGRIYETVEIINDKLIVTRFSETGQPTEFQFNPYWVRIELQKPRERPIKLSLSMHDKSVLLGNFLTNDEKEDFAEALSQALLDYRGGVRV